MTEQNIFTEFQKHLTEDPKPSVYFRAMEESGAFNSFPLTLLSDMKKTGQNPVHHPEGNVWNHTLLVVDNAAVVRDQSEEPEVLMWSALLHDIGKPPTTKLRKGRLTSYDHDRVGEKLARDFLKTYTDDKSFIIKVSKMVRWHMQVLLVTKSLPFANLRSMVKEVKLNEIALLAMCDRLGRGQVTEQIYEDEKKNIQRFIEKCMPYIKN